MEAMTTEELLARVKALEALAEMVSPAAPQQDDANG